jgi:hypothetical protein
MDTIVYSETTIAACAAFLLASGAAAAQTNATPQLRAGVLSTSGIVVDGTLDEAVWQGADVIDAFTQAEPTEGADPPVAPWCGFSRDRRRW